MKRTHWIAAAAVAAAAAHLAAQRAEAGEQRAPEAVHIYDWGYGGIARGALGELRHSSDTSQYLKCWVGVSGAGGCEAQSATGQRASCSFTSSSIYDDLRDQIRSISSSSQVQFIHSYSHCSTILVRNSSKYEPPRP